MTVKKKRLLIIDGLNLFLRNFAAVPALATNGNPIGGYWGFFKSMQKYMREINPDKIIVVWDGEGGSQRRKKMDSGYKAFRTPVRLNRNVKVLTDEENKANKYWQMGRLLDQLNKLPIVQVTSSGVEADDIIAIISRHGMFAEWQKVILSSDKDFLQLCDDGTVVYRPIQDKYWTWKTVIEEFGVHPVNFALARAATSSDKSDNIAGIPGIGMKTMASRFPFLAEGTEKTVDDVVQCCEEQIDGGSKVKAYMMVKDGRFIIEDNYRLMQLYMPHVSPHTMDIVRASLYEAEPTFNDTDFQRTLTSDGIVSYNWDVLTRWCNRILFDFKQEQKNNN